jgi:hypothetical protein
LLFGEWPETRQPVSMNIRLFRVCILQYIMQASAARKQLP